MVQRVGMLRLGNHHDAEELVQQVFVRAWKGRDGFDPARGSLGAWLLGITRRLIADRYASLDRDRKVVAAAESIAPPATDVKSVDRVVDRVVVGNELNRLPDEQRMVLRLAFYGDLSHSEIAATTGIADRHGEEPHPTGTHPSAEALGGGRCNILIADDLALLALGESLGSAVDAHVADCAAVRRRGRRHSAPRSAWPS